MCASKKIYIRNNNSGDSPGNIVVMGADVILKNSSYLALNRRHCFWLSLPSITPKVTSADLDLLYWRQDYFVSAVAGTRTRVPSCVILLWMVFQYIYHSTLAFSISNEDIVLLRARRRQSLQTELVLRDLRSHRSERFPARFWATTISHQ